MDQPNRRFYSFEGSEPIGNRAKTTLPYSPAPTTSPTPIWLPVGEGVYHSQVQVSALAHHTAVGSQCRFYSVGNILGLAGMQTLPCLMLPRNDVETVP